MLDNSMEWPVHDFDFVLYACDPTEPLEPGDTRHADFLALRHGAGIAKRHRAFLAPQIGRKFLHTCLSGHRGSGKSTELLAFKKWADKNGYLAVLAEVEEQVGMIQLEFSDLYLLAATVAEKAMQDFGHPLPEAKNSRGY